MSLEYLRQRSKLIDRLRAFFADRDFLEVQTPLALSEVIPERHIEPVAIGAKYLQASPELAMKRLLCDDSGPIFQIGKCFRRDESGPLHSPEFTMVEWYRPGDDLDAGMKLTSELLTSLIPTADPVRTSYRDAFERIIGIDPHSSSLGQLSCAAQEHGLTPSGDFGEDRDEWLNFLLAMLVEPRLGIDRPELLYHYPDSQAALAKTTIDEQGDSVAERFELYYQGIELANGYHELTDPVELRRRLVEANAGRVADGAGELPMPESLLSRMEQPGLPASCGVALGFDRLVMLAVGAKSIAEVMVN